jgi:predicted secreted protein
MRQLVMLLGILLAMPAWCNSVDNSDAMLNKVTLKLTAEQWVTSKTAVVTVGVNASVSDNALDKVQDNVKDKLNQLSNQGEWHITSFNRNMDQSGLEHVQMSAEARLPASALPSLRDKTKSISKPGETFTLDNVQFTPSEDEMRSANTALRGVIYQQAKDELDRLNKVYPQQKYTVHAVNFVEMGYPIAQNTMGMMRMAAAPMASPLAVGDKLSIAAVVVLAATPDQAH